MSRTCEACGRTYKPRSGKQRFCSPQCRFQGTRQTERRLYDATHRKLRRRLMPEVATGGVACARCGLPIQPGEPWDLDHADGQPGMYLGASHAACNRATSKPLQPSPSPLKRPDGPGFWKWSEDEKAWRNYSRDW